MSQSKLRLPSTKTTLVAAAVVTAAGFFNIAADRRDAVIAAVMGGDVWGLPYEWLLATCAVVLVARLLWPEQRDQRPGPSPAAAKAGPAAAGSILGSLKRDFVFWLGPIVSVRQAKQTIKVAGWLYIVCSIAGLMYYYRNGFDASAGLSALYVILVVGGPPAFLLIGKSRIAAAVLVGISMLGAAGSFSSAYLAGDRRDDTLIVVGCFWLFLLFLACRALMATIALKKADDDLLDVSEDSLRPPHTPS